MHLCLKITCTKLTYMSCAMPTFVTKQSTASLSDHSISAILICQDASLLRDPLCKTPWRLFQCKIFCSCFYCCCFYCCCSWSCLWHAPSIRGTVPSVNRIILYLKQSYLMKGQAASIKYGLRTHFIGAIESMPKWQSLSSGYWSTWATSSSLPL